MSRVATPPVAKPTTHGSTTTPPPAPPVPHDKIAMRAYEKWLKSGCQHGCDRQHWTEAEQELTTEMARQARR